MRAPLAHLKAEAGVLLEHDLEEHLRSVGALAGEYAAKFGSEDWGRLAGLWHDLGKYRSGFQAYIRASNDPDAHIEGKVAGADKTSTLGTICAVYRQRRSSTIAIARAASTVETCLSSFHHNRRRLVICARRRTRRAAFCYSRSEKPQTPELFRQYFKRFYADCDLDAHGISFC